MEIALNITLNSMHQNQKKIQSTTFRYLPINKIKGGKRWLYKSGWEGVMISVINKEDVLFPPRTPEQCPGTVVVTPKRYIKLRKQRKVRGIVIGMIVALVII